MSIAIRLGAAAALLTACTIDVSKITFCNDFHDCISGYICVSRQCVPSGGRGGNAGALDGGADALPPPRCTMRGGTGVTACPGTTCEETFCGGHLWLNASLNQLVVPYRIQDPDNRFSPGYRGAIRAAADAWTRASSNLVVFQECTSCASNGKFISVIPGDDRADGIMNPDDVEQFLPMPVSGRASPHWIAHQWGHVVGLAHTYQRADRDVYMTFDPAIWCPPLGTGSPPRCAAGPASSPWIPPVTTGTFGVFDGKSKMNGLRSQGVCDDLQEYPDEGSGEPTIGDISAAAELFVDVVGSWSPFRSLGGRSGPTSASASDELFTGVAPVGAPAIAEVEYASPEIFVRGEDDRVYTTARRDLRRSDWFDWTPVADAVDADPAVTFAYLASPETLFLAVRFAQDGNIHLRARRAGTWGGWMSLGAPSSGAASAPALASESPTSLAVFVRGGDGLIYELACSDANVDCASAASQGAWQPLPAPPSSGIFVGKPAATWLRDANGLTVAAITDDRVALVMTRVNAGGADWLPADTVDVDLSPDDPQPGVAITMSWTPGELDILAANHQGLLFADSLQAKAFPIGGVLASPPSAVAIYGDGGLVRTDVAALIDDHGHLGVWWRYHDGNYVPPCHYNSPTTCLQCGL